MLKRLALSALVAFWAGGVTAQVDGTVLAVTPALAELGRDLAPDGVSVSYPGPEGENASDWEPGEDQLRAFQQADLILAVGADYAAWTSLAALPRARLINSSVEFADRYIAQASDVVGHQHGPSGDASHHSVFANHFWLDLSLAREQVGAIAAAFQALWPELEGEIEQNLAGLDAELSELHAQLSSEFEALENTRFLASHPVYHYLDRAYGLNLHSFHWEPDVHPEPQDWAELDGVLASDQRTVMIWEDTPLPETLAELERRGVDVVVISPSPFGREGDLRSRLGFPDRIVP